MWDFDTIFKNHRGFNFHYFMNVTDTLVISEYFHNGAGIASMNVAIDAWWKFSDELKFFAEKYQDQITNMPESWLGESADSCRNNIIQYKNWLSTVRTIIMETIAYLEVMRNAYNKIIAEMPRPDSIAFDRDLLKEVEKINFFGSQTAWINKYKDDDVKNSNKVKESISEYYVTVKELTKDVPSFRCLPYKCSEEKPIPDEGLRGVPVLVTLPNNESHFVIGALGNSGAIGY